MADNAYCTLQDVLDIIPSSVVGSGAGQVSEAQITRLITKKTYEIEHWNNDIPFASTTVTNEYYEVFIDKFALKRQPIISITKLEIQQSDGTWEEQTQGRDDNTDDFFLEDDSWGLVRFHNESAGVFWCRVTYTHGYATTPYWLRDLCSKMVAVDVFMLKNYDEECSTMFQYWLDEIREYKKDINGYRKKIERVNSVAKIIGSRWSTTAISELDDLREWNK